MPSLIREHLTALYGERVSNVIWPSFLQLLEEFRRRLPPPPASRGPLALTQCDALLITYGDMVCKEGQPPLQTLTDFCDHHLKHILTGIHLLPHFPFTSDDGFSVTDYFAVNPELGTAQDLTGLGGRFDLMLDAVFNHMSAQSEWFLNFLADIPPYQKFFVAVEGSPDLSMVVRPRTLPLLTEFRGINGPRHIWTTFSPDQVDLDYHAPEVLLATSRALLTYVEQGARYIRLDAIAYLWKQIGTPCIHLPQTHRVIQFWRALLDELAPATLLITETNVPHADNISYFGDGRNEAQLVYNFALPPLVMHAVLKGEATHLTLWAKSLSLPSDGVTFFNFLASHDGIGLNGARGILPETEIEFLVERCVAHGGFVSFKQDKNGGQRPYELNIVYFDALNDPSNTESMQTQVDRFILAQSILLSIRGVPGIYFHSLFGKRNDRQGALSSGMHRRINRQKFKRGDLDAELAVQGSLPSLVLGQYRRLLLLRANQSAFHPGGAQRVLESDPRVFALLRTSPDGSSHLLCIHNVSAGPVDVSVTPRELVSSGVCTDLLSERLYSVDSAGKLLLRIGPYHYLWLKFGPNSVQAPNP